MEAQLRGQDRLIHRAVRLPLAALIAVFILAVGSTASPARAELYDIPSGTCLVLEQDGRWAQYGQETYNDLWQCGSYVAFQAVVRGLSANDYVLGYLENSEGGPNYYVAGYSTWEYLQAVENGGRVGTWSFGGLLCTASDGTRPFRCRNDMTVSFFSGNDCTGKFLGSFDTQGRTIIPRGTIQNDEARSMKIFGARSGVEIEIFDSPEGKTNDDWTHIYIKRGLTDFCVASFEHPSFNWPEMRYDYHRDNGLDGKVSRIHIYGR